MEKSISLELKRQSFHITAGAVSVLLIEKGVVDWKFFLLLLLLGAFISVLSIKVRLPVIAWFLKNFERKRAKFPGQGALFLAAGILMALLLFEKDIALASITILAVGDSVSHVSGRLFGRVKHPLNKYKLIEGTLIGFVAAAIGASFFVAWPQAMAASAAAMVVEGFELKHRRIDDNLLIPLVAGLIISVMRLY